MSPKIPDESGSGWKAQAQSWVEKSSQLSCLLWHCSTWSGFRHTGCRRKETERQTGMRQYQQLGLHFPKTTAVAFLVLQYQSAYLFTCVLLQVLSSRLASFCSCEALRSSFCFVSFPASLRLLFGVPAIVFPPVGVEGGWFLLRGLILTVSVWLWRWWRRLDLRGLSSTWASGRSARSFLRGIALTSVSGVDSVCFLLTGVEARA